MSLHTLERAGLVDAMTTQRAARHLLPTPIRKEDVVACIQLATHAPNGSNAQRWHWIVVSDPELRGAIADLNRPHAEVYSERGEAAPAVRDAVGHQAGSMQLAPFIVVACYGTRGPLDDHHARCGFYGSIFPAVQNFLLALHAAGLGATLTTMALRHADALAQLLGLPDDVLPCAVLPVGIPADPPSKPPSRRPVLEVCHDDVYGRPLDVSFNDGLISN